MHRTFTKKFVQSDSFKSDSGNLENESDIDEEAAEDDAIGEQLAEQDEEAEEFYNFTEELTTPDSLIQFTSMRMLQNICLLPNLQLIIEGPMMSQTVEIYQVEKDAGQITEPIQVIETGACGLNAICYNDDFIYMGFTACAEGSGCVMQAYTHDFEQVKSIQLNMANIFTDLSLAISDRFLVGSHIEGYISIINLETDGFEIVEKPFGDVDTIWAAEVIPFRPEGEPQQLLMPTDRGLFPCILTEDGQFLYLMQSHFLDQSVTNCAIINEDEVLCSIQQQDENKLVILNLETFEEKVIIHPNGALYILDITKIPSGEETNPYFILHTGKGISLINVANYKTYDLALNTQVNFNVCRSIDTALIDAEDPEQGFWFVQIDNGASFQMSVKAFDFDTKFVRSLRRLAEQAAPMEDVEEPEEFSEEM